MTPALPPISVIVASRGRPVHLERCLKALRLQDHPAFEVVVVADPAGLAAAQSVLGGHFRAVAQAEPGVAAARNAGLAAAGCDLVAFIDDDAVAEPTWLRRLAAVFDDPAVVAATGPVTGPRGIRPEWWGSVIDGLAREAPLAAPTDGPSHHRSAPGRVVVTIGTNCAFRRERVMAAGGFDPAFRYFLDESDLNARMAGQGGVTAFVPGAVVQHLADANVTRAADRTIIDLHEIGRSTAIFLRRHSGADDLAAGLDVLMARQRRRALRQMVSGRIAPERVKTLMAGLAEGFAAGAAAPLADLRRLADRRGAAGDDGRLILPGTGVRQGYLLAGRPWDAGRLRRRAATLVDQGAIVTVLVLSPTGLPHRSHFVAAGWWEHSGGLFRKTESVGGILPFCRFSRRVAAEAGRIRQTRPA